MNFTQLTATQVALLGAVVVGATEFISRLRAKDVWVAATIFVSGILGGLIGMHYHVDFVDGVAVGLGASGAIKTLSVFGNKSTPAPSTLTSKSK
jgi:hypothetical protein